MLKFIFVLFFDILLQHQITTKTNIMITITDFTEKGLKLFNKAKKSNSLLDTFDFVEYLINNDYEIKEVKIFAKKEFKNNYKFIDYKWILNNN